MGDVLFDPKKPARTRQGAANRRKLMAEHLERQEFEATARAQIERAAEMEAAQRRNQEETNMGKPTRVDEVGIRTVWHEVPAVPVGFEECAAQQRDLAQREVQKKRLAQEVHEREFLEQERRRLANGGRTQRQDRAIERHAFIEALGRGRWTPHERWAIEAPAGDRERSIASAAAQDGVRSALAPLLEEAVKEIRAADEERERLIAG